MRGRRNSMLELMVGIGLFTISFGPLLRIAINGPPVRYIRYLVGIPGIRDMFNLAAILLPIGVQAAYWLLLVPMMRHRFPRK